jgi:hypothetical protein
MEILNLHKMNKLRMFMQISKCNKMKDIINKII